MQSEKKIRLRDRREPGHLWADNEIYDVFGDELGQAGISLYMTLARLCWGANVQASLRVLAEHARMGKDSVSRAMQTLVRIGLVVETKSGKSRTVSTYSLTDAKALAREYVSASVQRTLQAETVSVGDSEEFAEQHASASAARGNTYSGSTDALGSNCLPQRQINNYLDFPENGEALSATETELSQKTPNLSQNPVPYLNKNKTQDQVLPPTPRWGDAWNPVPEDVLAKWRDDFDAANYFRAKEDKPPLEWEFFAANERDRYGALHDPISAPDGEFAQCATAREAANVMARRCNLGGESIAMVIAEAIELAVRAGEHGSVSVLGELAWRNYTEYQREIPHLRFTWGPRKFFREGHWLVPGTWPREKQRSRF